MVADDLDALRKMERITLAEEFKPHIRKLQRVRGQPSVSGRTCPLRFAEVWLPFVDDGVCLADQEHPE